MSNPENMKRYDLTEGDLLRKNGHAFVDMRKFGLHHEGKSCLD